jgi:RNA polymerase sigma-70 factor (ECF subfamily)
MNELAAAQLAMTDAADCLDPEIPAGAIDGVSSAAERLVRDHGNRIRRLVERLTAWSPDAADLTQDVFALALLGLPKFRGECAMESWLTRIAIHRCRRWQRRQRLARLWRKAAFASRRNDESIAPNLVQRDETSAAVRRAVAALPAIYREVVVLRYLEEKSAGDTATALGLRVNTVDVRLHRARALLADALSSLTESS